MLESDVATFWESHPCGDASVGGLVDTYDRDYEAFFTDYDKARYAVESHIPACLDDLQVAGKRVLEIGLGQGAESEQLIRRGAIWSGLDVTAEAVSRVRTRLEQRDLPFSDIRQGSPRPSASPTTSSTSCFPTASSTTSRTFAERSARSTES